MSVAFADKLDLIADVTGHHPLCVHLVAKMLAEQLNELKPDATDAQFFDVLVGALTEGNVCAADAIESLFTLADLLNPN